MKKNQKEKNQKQIIGKAVKDIVPSNYPHIRDTLPIPQPQTSDKVYYPETVPNDIPPEWNETDILEVPVESPEQPIEVFKDPTPEKIFLPYSLYHNYLFDEVKWERPCDYIRECHLDKAIQKNLPNRNNFKFRVTVHEMYEKEKEIRKKTEEEGYYQEEDNSEDSLGFEKKDKLAFYRDYFKILDTKVKIQVVNYFQREETDEEYEARMKKEEEELEKNKKEAKNKKKDPKKKEEIVPVQKEKLLINEANPGNISMNEEYPLYCKWLASLFQIIKDREIRDANTNETIWKKIYPQQNGIPVYNPSGKYWVKLYHFGKLRKIEIDDLMPCSKYDQFYLPRCEMLEEIWPAILTKALIKLYSFKIVSNSFKECGDYSPFYALTGYIPEMIDINKKLFKMFDPNAVIESNQITSEKEQEKEHKSETNNNPNDSSNMKIIEEPSNDNNHKNDGNGLQYLDIKKALLPSSNKPQTPSDTYVDPAKLKFLQLVLSDSNYTNKQCILLCYRKGDEIKREDNHIIGQKIYKTELQRSDNRLSQLKAPLRRMSSTVAKSTKSLVELKRLRGLTPQMSRVVEQLDDTNVTSKIKRMTKKNSTNLFSYKELFQRQATVGAASTEDVIKKANMMKNMFEGKIHVGFLYNVIEYFDNNKFNMKRLLPIDFSDLKAMVKQLNTTYVFKQLPREEKKIYIQKLKEIKQVQKQEKAKRIENLKLNGQTFICIKIGNSAIEDPHFFVIHTNDEIEMTKKCLLNNWSFPPISFLDKIYTEKQEENNLLRKANNKEDNKGGEKDSNKKTRSRVVGEDGKQIIINEELVKLNSKNNRTNSWNKDIYYQLINNEIEQYNNPKEPLIREKGTWIEPSEFFHFFNAFILLYNPKFYNTVFTWDNLWYNTNDAFVVNSSNKVLRLYLDEKTPDIKNYIVMLFSANSDVSNKFRDIPFGIHFDLLSQNQKLSEAREITMTSFFGATHIDNISPEEEHYIIFQNGIFPVGFFFKVLCDFKIEPMSYGMFLERHLHFNSLKFKIENGVITKNEPYVLLRLKVDIVKEREKLILFSNTNDKYSLDFTEIVICEYNDTFDNKKRKVDFDNMFELTKGKYVIVIVVTPPYNLAEESYDIELLHKAVNEEKTSEQGENQEQTTIEQIESIPPYEITDTYTTNKHFILFKEFVFAGDTVYTYLNIRARKTILKEKTEADIAATTNKKEKNSQDSNAIYEEVELRDKIRMKLEIYDREQNMIYTTDFYNSITLHNIIFEGNVIQEVKKGKEKSKEVTIETPTNKPYRIVCYLDSTELPPTFNTIQFQDGFGWKIRVFSSDTVAFAKDTSKEDRERALIASWEQNEPGRAAKAQKSRKRFLLEQQRLKGIKLSEEDEAFLTQPRERKLKENEKVNDVDPKAKDVKGKKKNEKSISKSKKDDDDMENAKDNSNPIGLNPKLFNIDFNKQTDKVDQHASLFIKNFLYYAYDDRMIKYDNQYTQEQKELNTETLKTEKEQKILSQFEQSRINTVENTVSDVDYRNELVQNSKKFKESIISTRKKDNEKIENALKAREDIKKNMSQKIECEKQLQELLDQEKTTRSDPKAKFDLNNAISIYKDVSSKGYNIPLLKDVNNIISEKKEEIIIADIKKVAKGKEKEFKTTAQKYIDDINENKWMIKVDIIDQLKNYIDNY